MPRRIQISTDHGSPGRLRPVLGAVLPLLVLACSYAADTQETSVEVDFEDARGDYEAGHHFDAVLKFSDFIREYPGSVLVDQAIYYRGRSYYEQKDWILAAADFERVVRDFPESRFACDAQLWLAETYWRQSRKAPYDQAETRRAIQEYERFQRRCPEHEGIEEIPARLARARNRLAEKQYRAARLYEKLNQPESALIYLGLVVDEYPDTEWATPARQDRARLLIDLGRVDEARSDIEWLRERQAVDDALLRRFSELDR
ncbi:MAG: outer membrane protein assembly factor BamD [Candidatus Eiseniibacteriota bacterium]